MGIIGMFSQDGLEVRRRPQRMWDDLRGAPGRLEADPGLRRLLRALAGAYIVVLVLVLVSVVKLERL